MYQTIQPHARMRSEKLPVRGECIQIKTIPLTKKSLLFLGCAFNSYPRQGLRGTSSPARNKKLIDQSPSSPSINTKKPAAKASAEEPGAMRAASFETHCCCCCEQSALCYYYRTRASSPKVGHRPAVTLTLPVSRSYKTLLLLCCCGFFCLPAAFFE